MPATRAQARTLHLVGGDDEFSIKETAARLAAELAPAAAGEFGLEIIDGAVQNQDEALKVLDRLTEAVQTVGFFGGEKLVWLKNTNLLADTPTTRAEAVKEALAAFNDRLKAGLAPGVRLLVSAVGSDRRRALYKTFEKLGEARFFEALEPGRASEEEITRFVGEQLRARGKTMSPPALAALRDRVAAEFREIANELEKLSLYVGRRAEITPDDVRAICSASRQAIIWELADALGARDVAGAVRALDNLLASGEKPIGVLLLMVAQVRLILLARDLMERRLLIPREGPGANFQYAKAFERLPENELAHFPRSKHQALPNAYRLYRCALAARNFTSDELVRAIDLLLEANRRLVTTQLDDRLVLEQAIIKMAVKPPAPVAAAPTRPRA
jgi:DNA polymerase-3 subunit delta